MPSRRTLRFTALACIAAGSLFWLYTFYHISQLPVGDGTGFQWIAEVPLTAIFLFMMVPSLVLAIFDRTVALAAFWSIAGIVLFAILWVQLLAEFAP